MSTTEDHSSDAAGEYSSAGEALTLPTGVVHAVRNVGSGNAAELATDVVEKGKPADTEQERAAFPDEIFRAPRSWVELGYPTLTYFHEADKGGHFAAWEEPGLLATEIRAAFKSLR